MGPRKHRIVYAFYSENWFYGKGDLEKLKSCAEEVLPEAYKVEMKDKLFCPLCGTPLIRIPSNFEVTADNNTPHFRHGRTKKYPESRTCVWRVKKPVGLRYKNEEEVSKAIENKELIVVSGWAKEPPSNNSVNPDETQPVFVKDFIEDPNGETTEIPIGRHKGKTFNAPSHISTVMALTRNFPDNLRKGFFFPNSQYAMLLSDQLYPSVKLDSKLPSKETLFFGKISNYGRLTFRNFIEINTGKYILKIYTYPEYDERKKIDFTSIGRYILFSATLNWEVNNSIIQCKNLDWGAYSLLPREYDEYLKPLMY
ncbi:hypothetical protein M0358_003377 [Vibrio fluvialis]|nr:hypothetical protein [Vibrio fluvialis]